LDNTYGVQGFNRKFVFNEFFILQPHYYQSQQGIIGRLLGGWTFAPIITAGSGAPLYCNDFTDAQAFGSGDGNGFFDNEQCVTTITNSASAYKQADGSFNIFSDPAAAYATFRDPILGIDTKNPGVGQLVGLPYWNVDLQVKKNFKIRESVNLELSTVFTNIFNHMQFADPGNNGGLDVTSPASFGVLNTQRNNPRQMEFGVRVNF
jgi:hypothetical protein